MRILAIFIFFTVFRSFGQEHHVAITAGRNRLDYLSGLHYSFDNCQHQLNTGVELGISRTFAQSRFHPRINVGYGYDCLRAENWSFGPAADVASSWVRISKNPTQSIVYSEFLGGYFFEYGNRLKMVHQLFIGTMSERFKSQFNQEKKVFWSSGYYASLGIKYRL